MGPFLPASAPCARAIFANRFATLAD